MEEMILNILGDLLYGAVLFVLGAAAQYVRSERRKPEGYQKWYVRADSEQHHPDSRRRDEPR